MSNRTENMLNHLSGVKVTGAGKWQAQCPSHDDKSPSLSVKETNDGTLLLRCWAGCNASEIVGAMGLGLSDLFPKVDHSFQARTPSRALIEARQQERIVGQEQGYIEAAERAVSIHHAATRDATRHGYILHKKIETFGVCQNNDGALVVPVYNARTKCLQSIQYIDAEGGKRFLTGGRMSLGCFPLRHTPESFKRAVVERIGIAEGLGTAASLAHVLGDSVAMFSAFTASNLVNVAVALRERYANAEITIYGDNDVNQVGNIAATKAALAVNGLIAIPAEPGTDWQDVLRSAA